MTRSTSDPAEKRSVSFPGSLLAQAERRARSLGYNLSAYIQHLMRNDLIARDSNLTRLAEPSPSYKTKSELEKAAKAFTKTKKRQAGRKSAA